MKASEREDLIHKIKAEIEKTGKSIAMYKDMSQPISPENSIGRISRMDAINNKGVMEAALRQAEQKLKGLEVMLTQVDDQDFGICKRCGNAIPFGRLLIMPDSPYCVACAR